MVEFLSFLPIFLIGLTSAQCPTECSQCKVINDGTMCGPPDKQFDCGGIWNLLEPNPNPKCTRIINGEQVNVCLYRREGDDKDFCFCDPGDLEYEPCTTKLERCGTKCYDYTGVDVGWYSLKHNDAASCNEYCLKTNPANTFFVLSGTDCACFLTEPPIKTVNSYYCDMPCTGRNTTKCGGGSNATFVSGGGTISKPVEQTDGACYNNTIPFYNPPPPISLLNNDKATCKAHCAPFTYIGLGSTILNEGKECYCGLALPPKDLVVAPYYCCGSPCAGNNNEDCGYYQSWNHESFINVWN